jgi:hypothetical protein
MVLTICRCWYAWGWCAGGDIERTGSEIHERSVRCRRRRRQLQILAAYPGAGPGEVEQALCIPIEEAIHELEGIRHINSVANQTECEVTVEFDPAIGAARFQAAIKAKIDTVKTFPKEIERLKTDETEVKNINAINSGDWVTINRDYAKEHGESALNGKYKIISKTVKAKDVFTNGDSIHEYGYWPEGTKKQKQAPSTKDISKLLSDPRLKSITVKLKGIEAETGKEIQFDEPADKALNSIVSRLKVAQELVKCLAG